MGKLYETITAGLQLWILRQKMFFVATAPLASAGHVNCSPKGSDSFRILGPRTVAYQDLTGSGVETIAHIRENGRVVIMFCSFTDEPKIVRLHGRGRVIEANDDQFPSEASAFPEHAGTRAIIKIEVERIADSCGYAVPLYEFVAHRKLLDDWTRRKGSVGLAAYRQQMNSVSIDGLRGLKVFL